METEKEKAWERATASIAQLRQALSQSAALPEPRCRRQQRAIAGLRLAVRAMEQSAPIGAIPRPRGTSQRNHASGKDE